MPEPAPLKLFSVVIPAHNEEESLPPTVQELYAVLVREGVPHEIVVVDDGSKDGTWAVLQDLKQRVPTLAPVQNQGLHGFGRAVICGLTHMKGDACTIMMAASACFSTPIGYQTNLMVMGPGGYTFSDYFRLGSPLTVLTGVLTVLLAPMIWPLTHTP